ncbi:NADPH dehydrogenase NamA [Pedobacter changchengzhani]|uniref:NADPH dehydrogenase NamA n=1 Tax=Pedobacter changchengzhani TaxID=2529274 RepID=A0A4R5MP84_9SPHI|nr:NADPH dehydrogenase NamA [Pedobacter changchengzhani]TDG37660.1 NADPH dehydrogenase NamA [Pedobacter changchengzhani]
MSKLFSALTIKNVTLKNRLVISPMCQYSSVDGFANDWHLVHLGSRSIGGAALIIQEATAVTPEGRITYGDMGIWKDEHVDKLKQIVSFIHANGAVAGIQLAHAGRKASCELPWNGGEQITEGENSWKPVAPSAIPFKTEQVIPHELSIKEIQEVVTAFRDAARRAKDAGFKVVEVHAAHGYLLHEFFSPLSNKRTDVYGGSFENRIRLTIDVVEAVQSVWPEDLPLFVRISATDWTEGGWTIEDSLQLAAVLKDKGVDLIDTSSGGNVPDAKIPAGPNYQVPFADKIRNEIGILTGAVGVIVKAHQAEEILEQGKADLIFIARESLRDAYFPLNAAQILGDDIEWPNQYVRAKREVFK